MFGTFLWFLVVSYCRILHFFKTKMALVVMVWYHILTVCLHLLHMILYFIYLGELHIKYTICTGPGQSRSCDLLTIIKATTKAHCLMCDKVGGERELAVTKAYHFLSFVLPPSKTSLVTFLCSFLLYVKQPDQLSSIHYAIVF